MTGFPAEERLKLELAGYRLSAVWSRPPEAGGALVAAHGRINDLDHPSLLAACRGAWEAGWAGLRFNFPYRELKPFVPGAAEEVDSFRVLLRAHRQAALWAARKTGGGLVLAGKSLGGRTAARLAAEGLACRGVIFLGYPLHEVGQPSRKREGVLKKIEKPMLFIQGGQDALGRRDLMEAVAADLGERASLRIIGPADHGFGLKPGAKMTEAGVMAIIRSEVAGFLDRILS